MELSLGVEPWSGVLEWNGVRKLEFLSLLGQDFTTDRQTATEWNGAKFWREPVG